MFGSAGTTNQLVDGSRFGDSRGKPQMTHPRPH